MTLINFEAVQEQALTLGFDDVGITTAHIPEEDILAYHQWIKEEFHGDMAYMENALRCKPDELLPGAKTAIIFVSYYKQEPQVFRKEKELVASYARGRDYHNVHRSRLKKFIRWLEEKSGQKEIAKGFSDSTPVLEKALAVQAGLGWFGKNTLLIHRKFGTFTLLAGVLTTLEIEPRPPVLRLPRCGACQKCLDACPTGAIVSPYKLDAKLCLSYNLIESKKPIPKKIAEKNPGYIFGCDICQDVCPHNIRKKPSTQEDFSPAKGLGVYLTRQKIDELVQKPELLFGSPLNRRGALGLRDTATT